MDLTQVLGWWEMAVPIPLGEAPTLMLPRTTCRTEAGEEIEIHGDRSGKFRLILLKKKGDLEEVRGLR